MRMITKAIRLKWEIPEAMFRVVPIQVAKILQDGSTREKLAAMKVLIACHGQNEQPEPQPQQTQINVGVKVDATATSDDRRNKVAAIVERLRSRRLPEQPAG